MEFFGDKTISLFDIWLLQHFLSGVLLGWALLHLPRRTVIFVALVVAYAWETLEYAAEVGLFGSALMQWFGGVEFILNRIIVDPLALVLGVLLARTLRGPWVVIISGVLATLWLTANIMSVDTMVIQRALLATIGSS